MRDLLYMIAGSTILPILVFADLFHFSSPYNLSPWLSKTGLSGPWIVVIVILFYLLVFCLVVALIEKALWRLLNPGGKDITRELVTLGDILRDPEKFSWGAFVYVAADEEISATSPALVVPDFDPALEEESLFADERAMREFREFPSPDDIAQVKDNLADQGQAGDLEKLARAATHYHRNDAFIES